MIALVAKAALAILEVAEAVDPALDKSVAVSVIKRVLVALEGV